MSSLIYCSWSLLHCELFHFLPPPHTHSLSFSTCSIPTNQKRNKDKEERHRQITEYNVFPFVSSLTIATNKLESTSLNDQQPPTPPSGTLPFIDPLKTPQSSTYHLITKKSAAGKTMLIIVSCGVSQAAPHAYSWD